MGEYYRCLADFLSSSWICQVVELTGILICHLSLFSYSSIVYPKEEPHRGIPVPLQRYVTHPVCSFPTLLVLIVFFSSFPFSLVPKQPSYQSFGLAFIILSLEIYSPTTSTLGSITTIYPTIYRGNPCLQEGQVLG